MKTDETIYFDGDNTEETSVPEPEPETSEEEVPEIPYTQADYEHVVNEPYTGF